MRSSRSSTSVPGGEDLDGGSHRARRVSGFAVAVPFTPGRMDALREQTDAEPVAVLEPKSGGFRNYYGKDCCLPPLESLSSARTC